MPEKAGIRAAGIRGPRQATGPAVVLVPSPGPFGSPLAACWRTCPLQRERRAGGRAGLMPENTGIRAAGISGSQRALCLSTAALPCPAHLASCRRLALLALP